MAQHTLNLKRIKIQKYLKIKDEIEPIVNEIRNKTKSIIEVPDTDEKYMIKRKIKMLEDKDEYLKNKSKIEAAVKDFVEKRSSGKYVAIRAIAEIHGIDSDFLGEELKRYDSLREKYQYDEKIRVGGANFSYQEEVSLLESLKLQFTNTGQQLLPCSCKTCFLLKLSTFVYEFAINEKKTCSPTWKGSKQADIKWIKDFEIRNSCEISTFCSESCTL